MPRQVMPSQLVAGLLRRVRAVRARRVAALAVYGRPTKAFDDWF